MKKTLILTLLCFVCSPGYFQKPRAKPVKITTKLTLPEAVELVRPSIIQIVRTLYGPQNSFLQAQPIGTAFIVHSSGYAITARHLFHEPLPQGAQRVEYRAGVPIPNVKTASNVVIAGNFQGLGFEVVDEDKEHDLALLKLKDIRRDFLGMKGVPKPIIDRALSLSADEAKEGLSIAISGYPFSSPILITTSGHFAASAFSDEVGIRLPTATGQIEEIKGYIADIHLNPGNSGGPVYLTESGKIIGVCRGVIPGSGIAFIVPVKYVLKLMEKNKISVSH